MIPAHFHDVDGDLFENNVENSDIDLITSFFSHILFSVTSSLLLYFKQLAYCYRLLGVVAEVLNISKTCQTHTSFYFYILKWQFPTKYLSLSNRPDVFKEVAVSSKVA